MATCQSAFSYFLLFKQISSNKTFKNYWIGRRLKGDCSKITFFVQSLKVRVKERGVALQFVMPKEALLIRCDVI